MLLGVVAQFIFNLILLLVSLVTHIIYGQQVKQTVLQNGTIENIGFGKIKPDDLNYSVKIGAKYKIPIILETPDITRHSNEIIYLNTILSTAK